jgi:hypothetical protein
MARWNVRLDPGHVAASRRHPAAAEVEQFELGPHVRRSLAAAIWRSRLRVEIHW